MEQARIEHAPNGSLLTYITSADALVNKSFDLHFHCEGYVTMSCQPVCGDNPRALVSGLSYVQVDKHGITILYRLHQCRP